MLRVLFVYGLILIDATFAFASNHGMSQPLPQDVQNRSGLSGVSSDLPLQAKEDLDSYLANKQEWNKIIPQSFRDIPEANATQVEAFDFASISDKLNSLEFGSLNSHLDSLHKSRRVRRYIAAQRRQQRRLLAQAKAKGIVKPEVEAVHIAEKALPGLLESIHNQLTQAYPDLLADQLDLTSAHPVSVVEAAKVIESIDAKVVASSPVTDAPRASDKVLENKFLENVTAPAPATIQSSEPGKKTYVEAFDNQTTVSDGASEMFSREPGETGWLRSTAYQHMPTLTWLGDSSKDLETPLISENTSRMLSALAGITLQKDAGLVFGKVAAGWKIGFSGRSEVPVYFDSNLRIVTNEDTTSEKYFVFLNAAPGAHLLYLSSMDEASNGAVALPVVGGTATYMDVTHLSYTTFSGKVVLAGDDAQGNKALSRSAVRLVGQPSVAGLTDRKGDFHFDHVMVVSDYPLFVETDKGLGFTHRYRVLPRNLQNLTLYRLSRNHINDWTGQMEGGVSSDSGIVLTAVPELVAGLPQATLIPSVRSIAPTLRMIPETYTLTTTDLLEPHAPLQPDENRFVGMEVPEGPVISQVTQTVGDKRVVVWSELTIVSPNVITLVGPY